MTPEPLKGKIESTHELVNQLDLKSAVSGLIKFHEDRIEELIKEMEELNVGDPQNFKFFGHTELGRGYGICMEQLKQEYESINAIEHWLEDAI